MVMNIDRGCTKHQGRQLAIDAAAAELMRDLLYNLLAREGSTPSSASIVTLIA
jgi:hypothetical protein